MLSSSNVPIAIECPRCGKHSIVQQENVYHCINCQFQRRLPSEHEEPAKGGFLAAAIVSIIVILLL